MSTARAKNFLARAKNSHRARHDRDAISHLIDVLEELLKSIDVQAPRAAVTVGSEIHKPPVELGKSVSHHLS
jgi:hypothetical protein